MDYVIRSMQKEDIPYVQHVAKTSWNSTYEGIIPRKVQENFLQAAYNDDRMEMRLQRSFLYVAKVDGKIAGFVKFSPVNEEGKAELGAIYLLPAHQGNGIGSALLKRGNRGTGEF
ncbi:hypothetical protein GCM10011409_24420 [Lentibacillus populi]|uniref:N-acetyltransferase domain-containing protein n=1 Tax=Lentibacillus populi TaxID=1827502 RepID=A0A9W5X661_9BACI|nr:hypothetical protein GCM10011409_24420 [Lentibacillus populi]